MRDPAIYNHEESNAFEMAVIKNIKKNNGH